MKSEQMDGIILLFPAYFSRVDGSIVVFSIKQLEEAVPSTKNKTELDDITVHSMLT